MLLIRPWIPLAVACLQVTLPLPAQSNLVGDRPGMSNSASLLDRTDFQVESGFYGEKQRAGTFAVIEPGLLFRYGYQRRLELRLRSDGIQMSRTPGSARLTGWMDMGLGLKWGWWMRDNSPWRLTLNPELLVPSGARAYSSGRLDPSLRAILNRRVRPSVALTWNVYWRSLSPGRDGSQQPRTHLHEYTMAAEFPVRGRVSSFVEYYTSHQAGRWTRSPISMLDTGLIYAVSRSAQVDLSFGVRGPGWNQAANQPKAYVAIGLVLRRPGPESTVSASVLRTFPHAGLPGR